MNPYEAQPSRAFWKNAVADRAPLTIAELWAPKFPIRKTDPVAALGSCFAQHISRALVLEGYNWINAEPAPHNFSALDKAKYQYEIFSARTTNIYTVALLHQWMRWAIQGDPVPDELWRKSDRFFDPFRPTIELNGFCSSEELVALREQTLAAIRQMFQQCHIFIFTLGLTEAWINSVDGYVYPMCPGTSAGVFDPNKHTFKNYNMFEIYSDLKDALLLLYSFNPRAKVLLTVSPVPLTATASSDHVLTATIRSKSVLRAVAASIVEEFDHVDYFPSYEIISSFPFRGDFYEPNMRSVNAEGVAHVMRIFLHALNNEAACTPPATTNSREMSNESAVDVVCEEMVLESYGR